MNFVNKLVNPKIILQISTRNLNAHTASITRTHRLKYANTYPTVVVQPDGSTFNIRYHEPRKIIKLPLDLSTLSEAERRARLEKRKPKKKIKIEEDIDDGFDTKKYLKYMKKKK
ncbi:39S ribosomal protein L55, mitochondrial [Chrysoperla carnea]|uniref:39S ribosomal protein L55, mitochondrial n=1 Tax=Chrysoperla carnea TaxID=189513 RepID=UPI001D061534|nr:39S ribosomal protein L55, mitochondrial [Chrysoperla carnea]